MKIIIGSARIDERGKISGGRAGDQKQTTTDDYKGEVSMQDFYVSSKGWYIIRPKSAIDANAIADNMALACNNKNLGYDQSNRYGVIKYGIRTRTKTECDCSSLVRACVKEATGVDPGDFNTVNETTVLGKTGLFKKKIEYTNGVKLYTGDILVTKTKGHTVIVVRGADRAIKGSGKYYPRYTGLSCSIVSALLAVGEEDTSFDHRKCIAQVNNITNYTGTSGQNNKMVNLIKNGKLLKP